MLVHLGIEEVEDRQAGTIKITAIATAYRVVSDDEQKERGFLAPPDLTVIAPQEGNAQARETRTINVFELSQRVAWSEPGLDVGPAVEHLAREREQVCRRVIEALAREKVAQLRR